MLVLVTVIFELFLFFVPVLLVDKLKAEDERLTFVLALSPQIAIANESEYACGIP